MLHGSGKESLAKRPGSLKGLTNLWRSGRGFGNLFSWLSLNKPTKPAITPQANVVKMLAIGKISVLRMLTVAMPSQLFPRISNYS
jgi:hypothetical protein